VFTSGKKFNITIGSFVVIRGDEEDSFDIGIVVRIYTKEQFESKISSRRPSNDKEEREIQKILRLPSIEECQLLATTYDEEEQLLKECQSYVVEYKIPMVVYGAEFQFDRKVLTFYYTSNSRADYRGLVRMMFNKCMVRIKMRKTNQCKKFVPIPFATQALKTGVVKKIIESVVVL